MRLVGLAIGLAIGACLAGVPGCHHEAPSAVAPDEHPPLPPASGTPVGYLLDASELTLHGDQRAELEAIDNDLAGRLAALDGASRAGRPGPGPAPGGHGGRHRGGRRGGMAGGPGRGGGMAGAGSGAAAAGRGPAGPAAAPDPGLAAGPGGDTRAAEVRAAVARALAVLDADQQVIARRVLTEHGVALDRGPGRPPAGDSDSDDGDGDGDPPRAGSGSSR